MSAETQSRAITSRSAKRGNEMTDLERAKRAMDNWCGAHTFHYIPVDPEKGEDPQAYLSLLFTIRSAIAEAVSAEPDVEAIAVALEDEYVAIFGKRCSTADARRLALRAVQALQDNEANR
jgi:hypothetical protein